MAHYTIRSPMYDTIEALNQFANELEAKRQQKELADLMGKMLNSTIPTPQEESWYKKPEPPTQDASPWNRWTPPGGDPKIMNFPGVPFTGPSALNPDVQRPQPQGFDFMNAMRTLLQNPASVQRAGGIGNVLSALAPMQTAHVQDRQLQQGDQEIGLAKEKLAWDKESFEKNYDIEMQRLAHDVKYKNDLLALRKMDTLSQVARNNYLTERDKALLGYEIERAKTDAEVAEINKQMKAKELAYMDEEKRLDLREKEAGIGQSEALGKYYEASAANMLSKAGVSSDGTSDETVLLEIADGLTVPIPADADPKDYLAVYKYQDEKGKEAMANHIFNLASNHKKLTPSEARVFMIAFSDWLKGENGHAPSHAEMVEYQKMLQDGTFFKNNGGAFAEFFE